MCRVTLAMVRGMMKTPLVGAVLVCVLALPAAAQEPCKRNSESGFSYCSPEGWTLKQV